MSPNRYFFIFLTLFWGAILLNGQNQPVKFKHITTDNGLSQNWVHCILQDQFGFIWIGTEEGLNRYDGYDFKIYKHSIQDQSSLPNSTVVSLLEDSKKNLWIGTNHGLALYNRQLDCFIKKKNWPQNIVSSIVEDEQHNLWLGTNGYLYYLNVKSDSIIEYGSDNPSKKNGVLSNGIVNSVCVDSRKNVWIGTNNGLNLFNKKTNSFINYYHSDKNIHSVGDNKITVIKEDKAGRLWIGTQKGLDILINVKDAPVNGYFIHYQDVSNKNTTLAAGQVLSLMEDNNHNLWIGSENGGLDKLNLQTFDRENPTFLHFQNNPNIESSISSNSIHSIYQDRQGIIWIGTNGKGLDVLRAEKKFEHYMKEPGNSNSISSDLVNTFFEDGNYLWIGTEGGLDRYDKRNQSFKHFTHNPSDKSSISSNAVWAIYKDLKGTLWIGTYNGGLNKFDYRTEKFSHFIFNPNDTNSISSNNIYSLFEDSNGRFWIGTMNGGLNLFDRSKGTFKHFTQDNSKIFTNYVQEIKETKKGDLLLVNLLSLERFNPETGNFYHFKLVKGDSINMGAYKVQTVMEDSKRNIWVGTDAGLLRIDGKTNRIIQYQAENGLPDNMVKTILEDRKGNIWLASNKGLTKFIDAVNRPQDCKFTNYTVEDGLQANEFRQRSCLLGADGYIYFGGVKGFNRFLPDSIKDNEFIPNVVITDFSIFNKSVKASIKGLPLKQDISLTNEIKIPSAYSVIGFKFVALNYISSAKNQYAYRMLGFEKEWNYVGNRREATYTNLEPGEYLFEVKASNNDNKWNEKGTSIKIIILPPWWKTIWFKLIVIALLILIVSLLFYYRLENYKKRQKELTELVNQRTFELKKTNEQLIKEQTVIVEQQETLKQANISLQEQNQRIEEYAEEANSQNEELKLINEQLLEKQAKIEEQSEELSARSENLKEVNDLLVEKQNLIQLQAKTLEDSNRELLLLNSTKDRLFSIIAHDLRNPFHAVSGFSEILMRDFDRLSRDKIDKYLDIINRSSATGSALLENLLQWSRAQTGRIVFDPINFDLYTISKEIADLLEVEALRKNIRILLKVEQDIIVFADDNMIKTVLRNLISNAIKFTKENGSITLSANKFQSHVEVTVADTGVGIAPEDISLLFNVDTNITTKGTSSEPGTGLGLILCKEFVVRNGGTIWVESQLNRGSQFKFTLRLA